MSQIELESLRKHAGDWNIIYLDHCDSTNTEAIRLATENAFATPAMVLTECQTAGRGRRSRDWISSEGSLTVSFVFRQADVQLPHQFLSLETGVSVAEALTPWVASSVQIKWPNDLVLNGCKLGGILVETVRTEFFVVGIGLNINNSLPPRQRSSIPPISLQKFLGRTVTMTDILIALAQSLAESFQSTAPAHTIERIQQRCFLTSKTVKIDAPGKGLISGFCEGVNREGNLVIFDDHEQRITLATGHILSVE